MVPEAAAEQLASMDAQSIDQLHHFPTELVIFKKAVITRQIAQERAAELWVHDQATLSVNLGDPQRYLILFDRGIADGACTGPPLHEWIDLMRDMNINYDTTKFRVHDLPAFDLIIHLSSVACREGT